MFENCGAGVIDASRVISVETAKGDDIAVVNIVEGISGSEDDDWSMQPSRQANHLCNSDA